MSKQKENKQPFKQVWSNNLFLIKLCFKASPAFVIFPVLDAVRNQVSIFFEHTVGIGYVLEAAEFGYPFKKVAMVILILFIAISIGMVFTVWVGDYVRAKEGPKVSRKIKLMLYEKAKDLDLECYDNPDYYNEMVLAISEVDKQIDRCIVFLSNVFSGLATFITSAISLRFTAVRTTARNPAAATARTAWPGIWSTAAIRAPTQPTAKPL